MICRIDPSEKTFARRKFGFKPCIFMKVWNKRFGKEWISMLKNNRIPSLLLAGIMVLSLAACSSRKAAADPAPTSAAEGEPVATHEVEVADQSVTTFQDEYGDEYATIVPKLMVDGKEADPINAALLDYISSHHPLTKTENGVEGEETRYAWGVRGDMVSIVIIASETFTDWVGYDVFSYHVETLQPASNEEILASFGMTADEFCGKVADAYRALWDSRPDLQENMSDLDTSIGAISLATVIPFITPDGHLGAAGPIHVTDSQFSESVRCFDLDTLKVEYFAEE